MANMIDFFKLMIIVQLFYSFSITAVAYGMPSSSLNYVTGFTPSSTLFDMQATANEVQSSLDSQTKIPVIELGALVFYSGNIILDLLLNFLTALPQMIGLVIHGIMLLFTIDNYLYALVEMFSTVAISIWYMISLIQLITGIRAKGVI